MTYPAWFALHRDPAVRRCQAALQVYAMFVGLGTAFYRPAAIDVAAAARELGPTESEIAAAVALLVAGGYLYEHPDGASRQYLVVFALAGDPPPLYSEQVAAHRVHRATRRGREQNADGRHTQEDLRVIFAAQKGRCYYCAALLGDTWHAEHKTPLSRGGSNWPTNMCCACPNCNLTKHTMTEAEFVAARNAG